MLIGIKTAFYQLLMTEKLSTCYVLDHQKTFLTSNQVPVVFLVGLLSFLSSRLQRMCENGAIIYLLLVISGVPQGSFL